MSIRTTALLFALLCLAPSASRADIVLLLAEPSGKGASYNPTGHVGLYLTRVCAESPTVLRRCEPGETGAVVSRYKAVAGLDWAAMPLIPYLYAVERAADVPSFATAETVNGLRDDYRRTHLRDLIPDGPDGGMPSGHWTQLAGAAYDRRLVGFRVATTPEQDDELIRTLNTRPNVSRFSLIFRNCADFARDVINHYYPGAVRSSVLADFGITTPKQVSRTFVRYSTKRPAMNLSVFVIPQIPGSRAESVRTRGVTESLVKAKRYAIPLMVLQPWVPAGLAAGYVVSGRFNPERDAIVYDPIAFEQQVLESIDPE